MNLIIKRVIFVLIVGIAGFLFYPILSYYDSKEIYFYKFNGEIELFGKGRDTKLTYVILSDRKKVWLGSWLNPDAVNLNKGDTLFKREKSFKMYLKRDGQLKDSFMYIHADDYASKFIKKVH